MEGLVRMEDTNSGTRHRNNDSLDEARLRGRDSAPAGRPNAVPDPFATVVAPAPTPRSKDAGSVQSPSETQQFMLAWQKGATHRAETATVESVTAALRAAAPKPRPAAPKVAAVPTAAPAQSGPRPKGVPTIPTASYSARPVQNASARPVPVNPMMARGAAPQNPALGQTVASASARPAGAPLNPLAARGMAVPSVAAAHGAKPDFLSESSGRVSSASDASAAPSTAQAAFDAAVTGEIPWTDDLGRVSRSEEEAVMHPSDPGSTAGRAVPQRAVAMNPYMTTEHAASSGAGGRSGGKGSDGGKKRSGCLSKFLIILGVLLLLGAGGIFLNAQRGYKEAQDSYKQLEQYAVKDKEGDGLPNVQFDELRKINPDIIAWIYVPGTVINYPVVQTTNNTKYLSKVFSGVENGSGAIFADMDDTAPGAVDQQTTLYGHHMYDGSMFNCVDKTLDQGAFDKFGEVYYITPEDTYKFKPMMTTQVQSNYTNARVANFDGTEVTFEQYLQDMLSQAKAKASDADERVGKTDKVLTLITCAGEIIPRTTRAVMVCSLEEVVPRQ